MTSAVVMMIEVLDMECFNLQRRHNTLRRLLLQANEILHQVIELLAVLQ